MRKYIPKKIEPKWQRRWEKDKNIYKASDRSKKKKFYCLSMFPYPSGDGLHVGHVESYTATDIYSRFKRMQGLNVIYPMGWDAFGLPAENYAIKMKTHPAKTTAENIKTFRKQMKSIGLSYDWDRELDSTDPNYYKWTQWLFLFLYKQGLAYRGKGRVNWCPKCKTVLANEQVVNGKCERCEAEVVQKELEQWYFKTTKYAKKLLKGLDDIDWPDSLKEMQRNWIGESHGAEIFFDLKQISEEDKKYLDAAKYSPLEIAGRLKKIPVIGRIKVFTTRPDTVFGATFLVLAPDGKIIPELEEYITNLGKIKTYQRRTAKKNDLQRTDLSRNKTGVQVEGLVAVNPANSQPVPVWTADYVLGNYAGGAIMSVPSHDSRDFEFAFEFNLPVKRVIYQEEYYRGFVDLSFVNDPDSLIEKLNKERFGLTFLYMERNRAKSYSSLKKGKAPYGIVASFKGKKLLNRYVKAVKPSLKKSFWSEIVGGKYITFVFSEGAISDDSVENVEKIKLKLRKAVAVLKKRRNGNVRVKGIVKALEMFSTDLVAWTVPSDLFKELVCYEGKEGYIQNSAFLDGMGVKKGWERMYSWLEGKKMGKKSSNFRLRDWLISRQRYWGAPIPMVYCPKCGIIPVPEKDLPVVLPEDVDFKPTGESPLKKCRDFYETKCPHCGEPAKREVDTMDTFVCSSWYYFRYCDVNNGKEFASQEKIRRYMPVDLYIGGVEHAVLHLLYSRFITKAFKDAGYVDFSEPFMKVRNQGMIIAPDRRKMSKSKGNVINPDDIITEFGADTLRMYEMFMGPLEDTKPWDTKGIVGVRRFLDKVWQLQEKIQNGSVFVKRNLDETEDIEMKQILHFTVKKVTDDIESLSFNTAISQMMILVNEWKKREKISTDDFKLFLKILSPFAPHITEELWEKYGEKKSIFYETWPIHDKKYLKYEEVEVVVQINGRKRDSIKLPVDISEKEAKKKILSLDSVKKNTKGHTIQRWVYIPGRIANIVIN